MVSVDYFKNSLTEFDETLHSGHLSVEEGSFRFSANWELIWAPNFSVKNEKKWFPLIIHTLLLCR